MEKVVYLILSREKDRFDILYVGDCENTDDKAFFVQNDNYKCWMEHSGLEKSLHLAILPLFESSADYRQKILNKILTRYKPVCNSADMPEEKPVYKVKKSENSEPAEKIQCACCGSEMKPEKVLEKSTLFRCTSCGISDTKINS